MASTEEDRLVQRDGHFCVGDVLAGSVGLSEVWPCHLVSFSAESMFPFLFSCFLSREVLGMVTDGKSVGIGVRQMCI